MKKSPPSPPRNAAQPSLLAVGKKVAMAASQREFVGEGGFCSASGDSLSRSLCLRGERAGCFCSCCRVADAAVALCAPAMRLPSRRSTRKALGDSNRSAVQTCPRPLRPQAWMCAAHGYLWARGASQYLQGGFRAPRPPHLLCIEIRRSTGIIAIASTLTLSFDDVDIGSKSL